jgi:hypothetical protein
LVAKEFRKNKHHVIGFHKDPVKNMIEAEEYSTGLSSCIYPNIPFFCFGFSLAFPGTRQRHVLLLWMLKFFIVLPAGIL